MIPAHEQRLRAERDAAVAEAAELRRQRDEHGASIGPAIDALHAAGILTFGTLAQGVEELAVMRDDLAAQLAEARAALSGKTMSCAKCEETERALADWCADISIDIASRNRHLREDAHGWQAQMDARGLWRDPAPARADESGGGS